MMRLSATFLLLLIGAAARNPTFRPRARSCCSTWSFAISRVGRSPTCSRGGRDLGTDHAANRLLPSWRRPLTASFTSRPHRCTGVFVWRAPATPRSSRLPHGEPVFLVFDHSSSERAPCPPGADDFLSPPLRPIPGVGDQDRQGLHLLQRSRPIPRVCRPPWRERRGEAT